MRQATNSITSAIASYLRYAPAAAFRSLFNASQHTSLEAQPFFLACVKSQHLFDTIPIVLESSAATRRHSERGTEPKQLPLRLQTNLNTVKFTLRISNTPQDGRT